MSVQQQTNLAIPLDSIQTMHKLSFHLRNKLRPTNLTYLQILSLRINYYYIHNQTKFKKFTLL